MNQQLPPALSRDVESIQSIEGVQEMLRLVCLVTGMGFSAVARVTSEHWVACSVLDQIDFGMKVGGELKIETTICNLIRDSKKEVLFDDISNEDNAVYSAVAANYGFKSYASFPIILDNGNVFGTLCAIDPRVSPLSNRTTTAMFRLFALWIALRFEQSKPSPAFIFEADAVLEKIDQQAPAENSNVISQLVQEMKTILHKWTA